MRDGIWRVCLIVLCMTSIFSSTAGCTGAMRAVNTPEGRCLPLAVGAFWIWEANMTQNNERVEPHIIWEFIATEEHLEIMDLLGLWDLPIEVLQGAVENELRYASERGHIPPGKGVVWDKKGVREPYRNDREVLLSLYMLAGVEPEEDTPSRMLLVSKIYSPLYRNCPRGSLKRSVSEIIEREGWYWILDDEDTRDAYPMCPVFVPQREKVLHWEWYGGGKRPIREVTRAGRPELKTIHGTRFWAVETVNPIGRGHLREWYAPSIGKISSERISYAQGLENKLERTVIWQEPIRIFIPSTGFYWRRKVRLTKPRDEDSRLETQRK